MTPQRSKVHLATWNGSEDPLDVYFSGDFNEWQQWQSRKNFECEFVVSLIAMKSLNQWLLAGVYRSVTSSWIETEKMHKYQLEPMPEFEEMAGRLVSEFERSGRQSYLNAENWAQSISLAEFLREKLSIDEFPDLHSLQARSGIR